MLHINIFHKSIVIKNVSLDSLKDVVECINSDESNLEAIGINKKIDLGFIKERYMESLVNPLEFFCGIYQDFKMVGIIKGRVEKKSIHEAWFMTFILKYEFRNKGLGTYILELVEDYLKTMYSIQRFCVVVSEENKGSKNFWLKNGYTIERVSNYFKLKDRPVNILVKEVK